MSLITESAEAGGQKEHMSDSAQEPQETGKGETWKRITVSEAGLQGLLHEVDGRVPLGLVRDRAVL